MPHATQTTFASLVVDHPTMITPKSRSPNCKNRGNITKATQPELSGHYADCALRANRAQQPTRPSSLHPCTQTFFLFATHRMVAYFL